MLFCVFIIVNCITAYTEMKTELLKTCWTVSMNQYNTKVSANLTPCPSDCVWDCSFKKKCKAYVA